MGLKWEALFSVQVYARSLMLAVLQCDRKELKSHRVRNWSRNQSVKTAVVFEM